MEEANQNLRTADRFKSEFLAMMSHEVRTPLNSIMGFTGVLQLGLAGDINPEQTRQLGLIDNSARHLLALITDLLDVSSIESGHFKLECQPFSLASVLHEIDVQLGPAATSKGLELRVRPPAAGVLLHNDRRRCFQILLNLADNAIKFTDSGSVEVRAERSGDDLRVQVMDTGVGMDANEISQLFEAFVRLDGFTRQRRQGSGLGLHLSRKLARLLGGDILVESERGIGSTFPLVLPVES